MSSNTDSMLKELLQNSRSNTSSLNDLVNRVTILEQEASIEAPATKRIRLTNSGNCKVIKTKVFTSAQQPVPGTSTSGLNAQPSSLRSRQSFPLVSGESNARAFSNQQDQPDQSSDDDPADSDFTLNQILTNSDSESEISVEAPSQYPILDTEIPPTWHPSDDVLKWFAQVADIELKDDQVSDISESYVPKAEVDAHFQPPLIPKPLWQKCKASHTEHKQMSLLKIQQSTTLAIKPLLSVLETLDSADPRQKQIASSIQLLCSSNLKTSRLRRSLTSITRRNRLLRR